MIQQGQVFKLKTRGPDGRPLWAYRYRLEGRGSMRPQVGGFATRAEAQNTLHKVPRTVAMQAPAESRSRGAVRGKSLSPSSAWGSCRSLAELRHASRTGLPAVALAHQ